MAARRGNRDFIVYDIVIEMNSPLASTMVTANSPCATRAAILISFMIWTPN